MRVVRGRGHHGPRDDRRRVDADRAAAGPTPARATTVRRRPARPRAWPSSRSSPCCTSGTAWPGCWPTTTRCRATENAHRLLDLEAALHLDVEAWANHLFVDLPGLPLAASYWYSALHYLVTPAVLLWVYRRHPLGYRRVRNVLVGATAAGLVGFVLLPVAPPRMLPGYVDVLATTSVHGWWGSDASAPKGLGGLTNELAAMPSLHVGWALWCAWVVFLCTRSRLAAGTPPPSTPSGPCSWSSWSPPTTTSSTPSRAPCSSCWPRAGDPPPGQSGNT